MNVIRRIAEILQRASGILRLVDLQSAQKQLLKRHLELLTLQYIQAVQIQIYETERAREERRLLKYGYKIYSQSDEDGIIREIFKRVGITNRIFIECGVGDGLENNSLALLLDGWTGLWIDCDTQTKLKIERKFYAPISQKKLKYICEFIAASNINDIIKRSGIGGEIDFLSIDIDGNDYHIFDKICTVSPRVVAIEYNAKFRPPIRWCMKYNPDHVWDGTDYFGASLESLTSLFGKHGYKLVGCNMAGVNAFFVREDLVGSKFCEPFTADNHYEPARYWISRGWSAGHPPNFGEFEDV